MGLFSDYRFAMVDNDLIVISVEANNDSPKGEYKLIQNGVTLDTQYKMFGKFSLTGHAGRDIEVKINQGIFGTKYQLFINGVEHELNKATKRQVLQMIEEKRSVLLNEAENFDKTNAKIFPILKPGDWNALALSAHSVLIGDERNPNLVIGYGYNLPNSFLFLTKKDLETKSITDIHEQAMKNIEEHEVTIEVSNELPEPILIASGDDFSAEKLLSKLFLIEAQKKLGTDELLIAIPRRRCMMIVNKKATNQTIKMFTQLHFTAWNEDNYGNSKIYNGLFIAKNGEIGSVFPLN